MPTKHVDPIAKCRICASISANRPSMSGIQSAFRNFRSDRSPYYKPPHIRCVNMQFETRMRANWAFLRNNTGVACRL